MALRSFSHEALADTVSTNTECFLRAKAGHGGRLWITAERQTGGRGRRGRSWVSERGNLYASLLLVNPAKAERLASLPLAVAVAVHQSVRRALPPGTAAVEIKWPNDILIGRRKTSGILIENEKLEDGRIAVAIGIGINVALVPEHPLYPVTSLRQEGSSISPQELFGHLFSEMAQILQVWNGGEGIGEIVALWRKAASGVGEPIKVNFPDRSIEGRFAGIDENGLLLLEQAGGGLTKIAAGDVFFT